MADKNDLRDWGIEALTANGKKGTIVDVCRFIWEKYENELKASGPFFYIWQYDVKRVATELRKTGKMKPARISPRGVWELF